MPDLTELRRIYGSRKSRGHNRLQVVKVLSRYMGQMRKKPQSPKAARSTLSKAFSRAGIHMKVAETYCTRTCPATTEYAIPARRNGKIFIHWGGDGVVFIRKDQ